MTTTYCTYTELANETGSTLSQTILEELINQAEREVNARLRVSGITGSADDALKSATLKLATANLLTRYRLDGTKPAGLTIGELSMSDNIDEAIRNLVAGGLALVQDYIKIRASTSTTGKQYVKRVN